MPPVARHCIFCHGRIPANEAVEHFPVGGRVAFDPRRGRLWAVCPTCHRWNLAPFEERWEALEELEKLRVDKGRVLASTDHIALIRAPGVELVRVGDARLVEEAWWRYGRQMMRRRTRARILQWSEGAAALGASIATGGMFYLFLTGDTVNDFLRWRRFGSTAWQGEVRCIRCGTPLTSLSFKKAQRLHLARDHDLGPALHLRCRRCRLFGEDGEFQLEGDVAQHVLRRVVTYSHFKGASEQRVRSATDWIDELGTPRAVVDELSKTGLRLDALLDRHRRTKAVALEIALNEENERRLLEMELAELEARWREEEEIASIVDGELTTDLGLSRIKDLIYRPDEA